MRKLNRKGFTMVELLVVLAILGLLAGIGVPKYLETLKKSREVADDALISSVQSAVDGFLAEIGGDLSKLLTDNAKSDLNPNASGTSVLDNESVTLGSFMPPNMVTLTDETYAMKAEKTMFKGERRELSNPKWIIDIDGKVDFE